MKINEIQRLEPKDVITAREFYHRDRRSLVNRFITPFPVRLTGIFI